jgi:hypothetical protein
MSGRSNPDECLMASVHFDNSDKRNRFSGLVDPCVMDTVISSGGSGSLQPAHSKRRSTWNYIYAPFPFKIVCSQAYCLPLLKSNRIPRFIATTIVYPRDSNALCIGTDFNNDRTTETTNFSITRSIRDEISNPNLGIRSKTPFNIRSRPIWQRGMWKSLQTVRIIKTLPDSLMQRI